MSSDGVGSPKVERRFRAMPGKGKAAVILVWVQTGLVRRRKFVMS